jgi:uncharacterized hydrophobic protein (TIGR00271 family)
VTAIRDYFLALKKAVNRILKPLPLASRKEIIDDITPMASPGFDYYLMVVLSCSIATLGLIINSPAVIIGAMLLAPLMSPIIGIGLASIIGDARILRSSMIALFGGSALAIALSFFLTLENKLLPFVSLQVIPAEILSRTRPTPIDLIIALAGGIAAAYALTKPNLSAALPGVAIATALMPPLCTIGTGLALGRLDIAGGATLLFITNAITIAFASAFVFFLRGFSASARRTGQRLPRSLIISAILVVLLLIPLTFFSVKLFREAADNRMINQVVSLEVGKLPGARLLDINTVREENNLAIVITIRTRKAINYDAVVKLQENIVAALDRPISLKIEQVIAEELDPMIPPTPTRTATPTHTATPGPSPTATPLPTNTPTPTATTTPTPASALLWINKLPPLEMVQIPGGPVIGTLKEGQLMQVLYGKQLFNGITWIEIMDEDGRIGWIPEIYIHTPTPTATR